MRDRTTKHFNKALVAYETLIDPHKRAIYDNFGIEGLKDRTWQLGVRSMSPEQFKFWLEENIRKKRTEMLEELVVSSGKVSATFDISGIWFQKMILVQNKNGKVIGNQLQSYPIGVMSQYQVSHSFHVPLDALAEILERPLPSSFKELWQEDLGKPSPKRDTARAKPTLSLECALGGAPPKRKGETKNLPASVLAGTSLTVGLMHAFPNLPPDSPRSIASLLAGNQIALQATILPTPMVTTQLSRGFGQNGIQARAIFIGLPSMELAPITECSFTRRLSLRHSVFIGINTGGVKWLSSLRDVFTLPKVGEVRNGFASIGYTYHPISSAIADAEEESGEGESTKKPAAQKTSRSKRTESYTVALNTGLLARGIQAKISWGRTFFVGTPLTSRPQPNMKHGNVGIRLGVETTIHITGAAQYTLKASRKMFENTVVGLNVSCGGSTGTRGITIGFSWSRLGQRISIPVVLAPVPDARVMIYATAIPLLTYVTAELLWLRPRDRKIGEQEAARLRRALRTKTLRRRKAAEEAVEVMINSVARKTEAERVAGGLVVLEATYGKPTDNKDSKLVADVTVAVAALVEQGQLVLPKGVDKSKIIGFYDPAPGSEKVLWVKYLFDSLVHEVTVKEKQGLVAPLRSHLVPGQA
jgi:DnaJ family protein C protein 11